jgi:hypothetical protein
MPYWWAYISGPGRRTHGISVAIIVCNNRTFSIDCCNTSDVRSGLLTSDQCLGFILRFWFPGSSPFAAGPALQAPDASRMVSFVSWAIQAERPPRGREQTAQSVRSPDNNPCPTPSPALALQHLPPPEPAHPRRRQSRAPVRPRSCVPCRSP